MSIIASNNKINVKIKKYLEEKENNILINKKDSILKLKELVNRIYNIPPERQNLLYKGKILDKTKLIEDYYIKSNDLIILVKKALPQNYKCEFINENQIQNENYFDFENLFRSMGVNFDFETYKYLFNNIPLIDSLLPILSSNPDYMNYSLDLIMGNNNQNQFKQIIKDQFKQNGMSNFNFTQLMQLMLKNNNNFNFENFANLLDQANNNNNNNSNNNIEKPIKIYLREKFETIIPSKLSPSDHYKLLLPKIK